MEYFIGLALAVIVAGGATVLGMDRERSLYPAILIVVASYYVLFAVMGADRPTLLLEILAASGFTLLALLGFKNSPWLIAAALAGHGVFDSVHHLLIENPGVPLWWPGFCLAFDGIAGAWLALRIMRQKVANT